MKKRFFSIFLCILILLPLFTINILAADNTLTENAELIDSGLYGKLYSFDSLNFNGMRSVNGQLSINPIPNNAQVDFGYAIKVNEGFKKFYTYKFSYTLVLQKDSSHTPFDSITYYDTYLFLDNKWVEFLSDPYAGDGLNSTNIGDIATDIDYSLVYDKSNDSVYRATFTLIFNCNTDTSLNVITPFFYGHNPVDENLITIGAVNIEVYKDYEQQVYQDLVYQQQQAIKNEIEKGFEQTNDSLGEIKDALTGDGVYDPPDPDFQDGVDNLGSKEEEIMDSISQPIKLPNGSTVQVNQDTLNTLKVYYDTAYNAPTYEETMGDQIEKIFDIFMPYLGTVIYLSLFLGLAIAFLTGRRLI